jgi:hypothetical protein
MIQNPVSLLTFPLRRYYSQYYLSDPLKSGMLDQATSDF